MDVSLLTETEENKLYITFRLYNVGKYKINIDQKSFVNMEKLTQGKNVIEQNYFH